MPIAAVAAITPTLPRNRTKSPTLFIAATRNTLDAMIRNACKQIDKESDS